MSFVVPEIELRAFMQDCFELADGSIERYEQRRCCVSVVSGGVAGEGAAFVSSLARVVAGGGHDVALERKVRDIDPLQAESACA